MKNRIALAALAAMVVAPVVVSAPASAQRYDSQGHRIYDGNDGRYRYRQRCKRSSGTTGLVAGAVGGGLIGNAVGGGTLGTLLGAGGGALLGKHIDQKHDAAQNRRNGC